VGKTSNKIKAEWNKEAYTRYGVSLRTKDVNDKILIDYLDSHKDTNGKGVTEIIKNALHFYIENGG
jgi:hypothetical protein